MLLVGAGLIASWTDIRETRIPNWLSLPLLAAGLLYAGIQGGWGGLGDALIGAVVASAIFVWAYIAFSGGAGDAKFMMGVGAWLGYDAALAEAIAISLVGFAYAILSMVFRGRAKELPYVFIGGMYQILRSFQGHFGSKKAARDVSEQGERESGDQPGEPSESSEPFQPRRARPEGWIPFAPAILVGTLVAWVVTARFGGFL